MLLFGIEILLVKIVLDVLDRTTERKEHKKHNYIYCLRSGITWQSGQHGGQE